MHSSTGFSSELCFEPSFVRTCDTDFAWACCFSCLKKKAVFRSPSIVWFTLARILAPSAFCNCVSRSVDSIDCIFRRVFWSGSTIRFSSSRSFSNLSSSAISDCFFSMQYSWIACFIFAFPTSHHCSISIPAFAFCHSFHAFVTMSFRGSSFSTSTLHFQYPGPLVEYSIGKVSATGWWSDKVQGMM